MKPYAWSITFMDKQPKKKRNILVRLVLFLLAAAIVLGAVGIVVFRDRFNMDSFRRWFTYRTLSLNDSGQAESFRYSGSVDDVFADLDGDLLVCTGNAISLYSGSGTQYIDQQVSMSAPAVDAVNGTAVVYDAGGSELYVFRQRELLFELDCDGSILSAHLNSSGLLTVVSQETGYRGVVTVYNTSGQVKAALRLSSAYIMEAVLSDNGNTLAVVTIGQNSGSFASTLLIYALDSIPVGEVSYEVTPTATTNLGSSIVLSLKQSGNLIWALGDQGISVLDSSGTLLNTVGWSDRYLKSYSLSGDGFAVAQLGKYRAGSQSTLYVVDGSGALASTLSMDEQILSLGAAGRYFAVLTADRLDIYTSDMQLYSTLSGTQDARKVLMRADGTAMLISADSARLYVPSEPIL